MENLIEIHRRFSNEEGTEDLEKGTTIHAVYLAERAATVWPGPALPACLSGK